MKDNNIAVIGCTSLTCKLINILKKKKIKIILIITKKNDKLNSDYIDLKKKFKNIKIIFDKNCNKKTTINLIKKRKFNSIIINYDEKSQNFFSWYQQLVAESLGKKGKGLLPVVSNMPRDNHSVMQLYLDGFKNNFYTFFYVHENNTSKIDNKFILPSQNFHGHKKTYKNYF